VERIAREGVEVIRVGEAAAGDPPLAVAT
jgi:hypothetical protein